MLEQRVQSCVILNWCRILTENPLCFGMRLKQKISNSIGDDAPIASIPRPTNVTIAWEADENRLSFSPLEVYMLPKFALCDNNIRVQKTDNLVRKNSYGKARLVTVLMAGCIGHETYPKSIYENPDIENEGNNTGKEYNATVTLSELEGS
ncbi:hypothetical protein ACPUEK_01050 [Marinomonas gallaica]|uniref:hypothetical protein n=1 Tax=Marinomonas gallaica TaxID=1806667 RepID=UPI003CE5275B